MCQVSNFLEASVQFSWVIHDVNDPRSNILKILQMFYEEGECIHRVCSTSFSKPRATCGEYNKKQLQFPDSKHDKKPRGRVRVRATVALHYTYDLSFTGELDFFVRVKPDKQRHKRLHMFQPSAAPVLICYLASSWLVIFRPQVEPSTSA